MGAKLFDECERYFDHALQNPMPIEREAGIRSWYATLAGRAG